MRASVEIPNQGSNPLEDLNPKLRIRSSANGSAHVFPALLDNLIHAPPAGLEVRIPTIAGNHMVFAFRER